MDGTRVGTAAILVNNVYCVASLPQELSGKATDLTVKSVFTNTIGVNSAPVTASAMSDTDSDDAHVFRLCAVGQVWLDLLSIK